MWSLHPVSYAHTCPMFTKTTEQLSVASSSTHPSNWNEEYADALMFLLATRSCQYSCALPPPSDSATKPLYACPARQSRCLHVLRDDDL